jgi:hypothetical protein
MPTYVVTAPDGKKYRVTAPEGASEADVRARVSKVAKPPKPRAATKPKSRSWLDVPGEAISNIPSSAWNFVSGIADAVTNPVDTATTLADLAAGTLRNVTPAPIARAIDRMDPNPQAGKRASRTATATGQFFKQRYGSSEGIKNTLATDPVGAASDVSALLSAGASLAGKAPRVASALRKGAARTNPVNAITKTAKAVGRPVGNITAELVGGLGTRTGSLPIKEVAKAGRAGGKAEADAIANMRGKVPMTDVLDDAKANLAAMGQAKSAEYRTNMAAVSNDKSVLSFDGIDKAVQNATDLTQYKGQVKNAKAAQAVADINKEISNWKSLDPAEYHTPEGLDALKQKIWAINESIPFEEKTARTAAGKIYNSVKDEIAKQAPTYTKTMKDYSEAADEITEIEKALSLGKKASVDTAMRKLQSLTRNNVNTNFGNRTDLARELESQGGRALMPALAGQALNTWTPRGLGSAVAGGVGLGGYAIGGVPMAAGTLAVQSPRLVGEVALKAGQSAQIMDSLANYLRSQGVDPATLANYLAAANRDLKQ